MTESSRRCAHRGRLCGRPRALANLALVGGFLMASGCARPSGKPPTTTQGTTSVAASPTAAPVLARLSPDTLHIVRGNVHTLVLQGSGFTVDDNTVVVGPITLGRVRSRDGGTRIDVTVPDLVPTGGEVAPQPWMAGRYPVRVSTAAGASAALYVFVTFP